MVLMMKCSAVVEPDVNEVSAITLRNSEVAAQLYGSHRLPTFTNELSADAVSAGRLYDCSSFCMFASDQLFAALSDAGELAALKKSSWSCSVVAPSSSTVMPVMKPPSADV